MSVKHLEYLKINDSKVLVVEVRPVKCLLDSSSGPTHTDKWMERSHWKELYHLMTDIVEEYEEQKTIQAVKCDQPKCKTGATIQVGYMFRGLPSCWCSLYFLTPRNSCTWAENDANGELQDKGGRFEDFAPCGEMLVISVILRDSSPSSATETTPTPSCSSTSQQVCLNQRLIKALDSRATYVNPISDYFKASTPSTDDSPASCVPSSSRGRERNPSQRVKTSTSCSAEQENKGDESNEAVKVTNSSDRDISLNTSRSLLLKEGICEVVEREMDVIYGYNSQPVITNIKLDHDCIECTKKVFTVTTYNGNNLESIERPTGPGCQCSAINSVEAHNNSAPFTSESEDMFTNLECPTYQHDTSNDSNVSCSRSENLCNPLRDNTQWKSDSLQSQTDSCSSSDSNHETDESSKFQSVADDSSLLDIVKEESIGVGEEYCVSHEMDIWNPWMIPIQGWEVVQTSESSVNGNECEGQEDTLPHMIHNNYLPGENTSQRENDGRHPTRPVEQLASTSEDQVLDAVNSTTEDLPVSLKFEYFVPESKLVQVEANQGSVLSTSPIDKFHAANEVEEVLHCWSNSTEKCFGYNVPSLRTAAQECLPPGRLLTPMTDIVLCAPDTSKSGKTCDSSVSPQTCDNVNFVGSEVRRLQQSSQPECHGAKISIKSILKKAHSSRKTAISIKSMKVTDQQTLGKEQHEKFDSSGKKCKAQVQNVNVEKKRKVHPSLTKASKASLPKEEDRWMGISCSGTSAVAGESSAREDLPAVKEGLHSQSESHRLEGKLLHDRGDPSGSRQNSCGATADEADKEGSTLNFLANHSERCNNKEKTSVYYGFEKPKKKLELQDDGSCRADEEYIPSKITHEWKKTKRKRNMPNLEPEYVPTSLRALPSTDTAEDSVLQEGDGARDVGASVEESHGSADKCETKLAYHNASCRADLENVPEKVTCKWKKRKSKNVPNPELENGIKNVTHFSAEHNYPCSEKDSVVTSDLTHDTQVSVGLPLCEETRDRVSERKKQQIQTGTCDSLFPCKKEYDAGNTCMEDLDLLSASTEQYDSQEIADTLETQQECVPTQRLVSHGNEKTCNKIDHLQSSQNCTQSYELNKEPLEKSTLLHRQQAAQKGAEEGVPIIQLMRSFRNLSSNSKYEDKQNKKKIAFRSKKNYDQTGRTEKRNTCMDQKLEGKKQITSHISASDTPMKSSFCCSENIIGESVLEDDKLNSFNCKHRKPEVSVGMKKPQMKVTGDDAVDTDCVSKGVTPPKRKKKSVLSYEEDHFLSREKESTKNCVSLTAGSDQSGQDTKGASSNNHPSIKMPESTRLPEKNSPESLCLRRSTRLKGKIPGLAWLFSMYGDSDLEEFSNKHDIAKETQKSLKFFEKYVQQRNANASKSNLKQKKILDYVRRCSTSEQENQCEDWLFKSPDRKKSPVNVNKKVARSVKPKCSKTKTGETSHSVRNASPELPRLTVSKQDASKRPQLNVEKAASKCHKETCDFTSHDEQRKKRTKNNKPVMKKGKKSVSQERENVSPPEKVVRKRGRKKKTITSDTSTSDDLARDIENCASSSEKGARYWSKQAEMEEQDSVVMDAPINQDSCSSRTEEESSEPREKVVKKSGRKKKAKISDTLTVDCSEKAIENCAAMPETDTLHWIKQAEMEEQDSVLSDDTSNQDSCSSPRGEEESSESVAKEEQPQHTEREDDLDIIYYHDMDSLKASYKRLQSMTESDLEQRLNENLYYLEQVIRGRVPNERHEMFVSSLQRLKQQQDYLICGPFTTHQTEYVLELLKKKLSHLDSLFVNLYDVLTYRCRVLMPTFLTKIVMDNENISLRMAEDLMVKFSLDEKITGATSSRDWRKF